MSTFDDILDGLFDNCPDISQDNIPPERLTASELGRRFAQDRKYQRCSSQTSQAKYAYKDICCNKHVWFFDKRISGSTCQRCGCSSFNQEIPASYILGRYIKHSDFGYTGPSFMLYI